MKRVIVINNTNERQFRADFENEVEMQAWIDEQVLTDSWGLNDRWLEETDGNHTDERQVLIEPAQDERTVLQMQYDEEGNELEEIEVTIPASEAIYKTEYFFPCEYEIEITDITSEKEKQDRLQAARQKAFKNQKDLEFGQFIIALVGAKNEEKELTHEQKNSMMSDQTVNTIMIMLQAGRVGYAKQLIEFYEVNDSYFTQDDKDEILQLLNDYLGVQ
jgi:hypothetical protein